MGNELYIKTEQDEINDSNSLMHFMFFVNKRTKHIKRIPDRKTVS